MGDQWVTSLCVFAVYCRFTDGSHRSSRMWSRACVYVCMSLVLAQCMHAHTYSMYASTITVLLSLSHISDKKWPTWQTAASAGVQPSAPPCCSCAVCVCVCLCVCVPVCERSQSVRIALAVWVHVGSFSPAVEVNRKHNGGFPLNVSRSSGQRWSY